MIILSNGYRKPEVGDFGDVWFPALEDNIERVNAHTHNGSDSPLIPSSSITGVVQQITAAEFVPNTGTFTAGRAFKTTLVVAGGSVSVATKAVIIRDNVTRNPIYMEYEQVSNTQIDIFTPIVRDIEVLLV